MKEENSLREECTFAKTLDPQDIEKKMKTWILTAGNTT